MTKRKSSKSFEERQRSYDNFLINFPELKNYVCNFNSHKKHILLQGATRKDIDVIAENIYFGAVKPGIYDFLSSKSVNCSTSTYKRIQQIIFEDIKEEIVQIEILLEAYLLSLIDHKQEQGSYKYPEMEYRIGKAGHNRSGVFTEKGLVKLSGLTRNILKKESIPLSKDTYVEVLERLLGLFFDGSSFIKFKAVGLVDVSRDDRIELGIGTDTPNVVIATLKEGDSVGKLSPVFRDRKLFELVSLGSDKKQKKGVDTFEDVKLEITIDGGPNLNSAIITIRISVNDASYEQLELAYRHLPVLYVLASAVKDGNKLVTNKDLKKEYKEVDEAKCKIVEAFAAHITEKRAAKIVQIRPGVGKSLLIPRKNITIHKVNPSQ